MQNQETLIPYEPFDEKGERLMNILLICILLIFAIGFYAYFTLPEKIPTHFNFKGEPDAYGSKIVFLILPFVFNIAPIIFFFIAKYRFTLINKHPYLLSLPGFFSYVYKIPYEKRGKWANEYFKIFLELSVWLSVYLLILEIVIFKGTIDKKMPQWFLPVIIILPFVFTVRFFLQLRKLLKDIS